MNSATEKPEKTRQHHVNQHLLHWSLENSCQLCTQSCFSSIGRGTCFSFFRHVVDLLSCSRKAPLDSLGYQALKMSCEKCHWLRGSLVKATFTNTLNTVHQWSPCSNSSASGNTCGNGNGSISDRSSQSQQSEAETWQCIWPRAMPQCGNAHMLRCSQNTHAMHML